MRKVFAIFLLFTFVFEVALAREFRIPRDWIKAKVVRVIDGDTIVVSIPRTTFNGRKTLKNLRFTVRLIGVDTPESKVNRRAKIQAQKTKEDINEIVKLGKLAKQFTKKLLPKGQTVFLEFDVEPQDRYGRLLAYVWLKNGIMVNKAIICGGFAYPLTVPPNVKYEKEFRKCFRKAIEEKRGLWGLK